MVTVRTIVLDTNAILMAFQFKINIESELDRLLPSYKLIVPSTVIDELRTLKNVYAKAGLRFAERHEIVPATGAVDSSIRKLARELNGIVVTNDRALRAVLRRDKILVIFLRGKTHLELCGEP